MGFLAGKRALIVGVATERSIAWGIAQAMHREGAELAFTYGGEKLRDRVEPLAQSLGAKLVLPLDVTDSVRGSRTSELIARCMVETGTSSYYTALAEAGREFLGDGDRSVTATGAADGGTPWPLPGQR
jgi:enoyl-[acyl-carrier-protein] reductase (NADH)